MIEQHFDIEDLQQLEAEQGDNVPAAGRMICWHFTQFDSNN